MNERQFKKRLEELAEGRSGGRPESEKEPAPEKVAKRAPQAIANHKAGISQRDVKRLHDALSAVKASVAKLEEEIDVLLEDQ